MNIILIDTSQSPIGSDDLTLEYKNPNSDFYQFIEQRKKEGDRIVFFDAEKDDLKLITDTVLKENSHQIESFWIFNHNVYKYLDIVNPDSKENYPTYYYHLPYHTNPKNPTETSKKDYWKFFGNLFHVIQETSPHVKSIFTYNEIKKQKNLYHERVNLIMDLINTSSLDPEIIKNSKIFLDQWGEHLAQIDPKRAKQLWIDPEFQISGGALGGTSYYRGINFNLSNKIILSYIDAFANELRSRGVQDKFFYTNCVPIDRNFENLKEILGHDQFTVLTDSTTQKNTTETHSLLVLHDDINTKDAIHKIQELGLQPTPLKLLSRIAENTTLQIQQNSHTQSTLKLNNQIRSLDDLLSSKTYKKFSKLSSIRNPDLEFVNLYTQSISDMLLGLQKHLVKQPLNDEQTLFLQHSYQLIETYMSWFIMYHKDHRRAANFFEWMVEEIHLNLIVLSPYKDSDFNKIMHQNIIKKHYPFMLEKENNNQIMHSFALYNSGMRSFYEAFTALTHHQKEPEIVCINNTYYEIINATWKKTFTEDFSTKKLTNHDADIYICNLAASLAIEDKKSYFIDPDELANEIFSQRKSTKPVTLLLDLTISNFNDDLVKKLLINHQQQIQEGKLNIVFASSLQKYGMMGTDKVQAGFVWAINNPQVFQKLNDYIANPNYHNHYQDIQLICHIFKYAYEGVQHGFNISTQNADILRQNLPSNIKAKHRARSPFHFYRGPIEQRVKYPMEYFLNRDSFGFTHAGSVFIKDDKGLDAISRITSGHEGETKTKTFAEMLAYQLSFPNAKYSVYSEKDIQQSIRSIAKICSIPLETDNTVTLITNLSHFLRQDDYRAITCDSATELTPFLKHFEDLVTNTKKFPTIDEHPEIFKCNLELFNVLNLLIRRNNIPLPPEVKEKFTQIINKLKTILLQNLNPDKLNHHFFFITYDKKTNIIKDIDINIVNLRKLRDFLDTNIKLGCLTDETTKEILSSIKYFLLTLNQNHYLNLTNKLQIALDLTKLSYLRPQLDEELKYFYPYYLVSYEDPNSDSTYLYAPFNEYEDEKSQSNHLMAFDAYSDNKKEHFVDIIFASEEEAQTFAKQHGLEVITDLSKKYSRDPNIHKRYNKKQTLIRISDGQYANFILQELNEKRTILPKHNPMRIILNSPTIEQQILKGLPQAKSIPHSDRIELFFNDSNESKEFELATNFTKNFSINYQKQIYEPGKHDLRQSLIYKKITTKISQSDLVELLITHKLSSTSFNKIKSDLISDYHQQRQSSNLDFDLICAL